MMIYVLIFWLFLIGSASAQTTLGTAATNLAAGSWTTFTTNISAVQNQGLWATYSDSGMWDPTTKKQVFLGSYHPAPYVPTIYDDATNTWSYGPQLPGIPFNTSYVGHGYDQNALDSVNGYWFFLIDRARQVGCPLCTNDVYRYNFATNTWTGLPRNTLKTFNSGCCDTLTYFPDMKALLWIDPQGAIWRFSDATQAWSSMGTIPSFNGTTWNFAEYNPIHRVLVVGNSTGRLFKITATGVISQLANIPFTTYTGDGNYVGKFFTDPISGEHLFLTPTRTMWKYDLVTNTYTQLPNPPAGIVNGGSILVTSIPTYGVIMVTQCGTIVATCAGATYLYKHAASTTADLDFLQRCYGRGVTFCNPFNRIGTVQGADLVLQSTNPTYGNLHNAGDGVLRGSVDTTQKRSGAGSLRFILPANNNTDQLTGQYLCCGSGGIPMAGGGLGTSLGENQTLYVQFAARFSANYFNYNSYWQVPSKLAMLHYNAASCATREITLNTFKASAPHLGGYFECGSEGMRHWVTDGATWRTVAQGTPYLYQSGGSGGLACAHTPPPGNCWDAPTDKWITFLIKIQTVQWNVLGSTLEISYAVDGGPYVKYINLLNNFWLRCESGAPPCPNEVFNNITLTAYKSDLGLCSTCKSPNDEYVWYDELIVSRQPIAAPGQPVTPPIPPTPSGLTVTTGKTIKAGKVIQQ